MDQQTTPNTSNQPVNSIGELSSLLNFDVARPTKTTPDAFAEALKEIQTENTAKAKEQAKKKIQEVLALVADFKKIDEDYMKAKQKFEKTVKGYINDIKRLTNGQEETPASDPQPA